MAEKRKARKKASKKLDITQPIQPIDIFKIGSDDDPCFGKLWDLTEDTCKRCGDSTICGIAFNQGTVKLRDGEEKASRFKDIELSKPNNKEVKAFIKKKLKAGTISLMICKQLKQKWGIEKTEAKKLIKKLKG